VVVDMVRLAVEEVPGVHRLGPGGPAWRRAIAGAPVVVRLTADRADARIVLIARPGQSLVGLAAQVRSAVAVALERLLDLQAGTVTVLVDGVGG
jgi:uncharacterized alkaline shock family protein YloU